MTQKEELRKLRIEVKYLKHKYQVLEDEFIKHVSTYDAHAEPMKRPWRKR